jgi:hypothetical protein
MRLDLPGATFSWIWHPGGNLVHRNTAGSDFNDAPQWTQSVYNGLGADGNAYVIRDFFPDGEPQANDYSWGGPMTMAITSETIDVASTLFTINFNLYATDGSTSTGGAGTQSLRKSFDLIHYANNTWNQGTADDWYGNTRAIGPTGEDPGWNVVGGGTWNPGYLTAAPVPEPTSLAVLAVGSILALRRRAV